MLRARLFYIVILISFNILCSYHTVKCERALMRICINRMLFGTAQSWYASINQAIYSSVYVSIHLRIDLAPPSILNFILFFLFLYRLAFYIFFLSSLSTFDVIYFFNLELYRACSWFVWFHIINRVYKIVLIFLSGDIMQ